MNEQQGKKMQALGRCALCLSEGIELKHSHIISEFNYKPCYDEKGKLIVLSNYERPKERPMQKGFREYLLCGRCEGKFSKWEDHARRVLGKVIRDVKKGKEGDAIRVEADYAKFRLYGLSTIWRMGISTGEAFRSVDLGADAETLRLLLLNEDAGTPDDYPFAICAPRLKGKFNADFIISPSEVVDEGVTIYACVIWGLFWSFHIQRLPLGPAIRQIAMKPDGTFLVVLLSTEHIPLLHEALLEQGEIIRGERPRRPRS